MISLYRSALRHPLFTALNVGGLALGIATFLVLFLFVQFETGFDRSLPGSERLWSVQRTMSFPGVPDVTFPPTYDTLDRLQAMRPGLEGTRLRYQNVAVLSGNSAVAEVIAQVDQNFFTFFPHPQVAGSVPDALTTPDGAVVTESFAREQFGTGDAIGRTFDLVSEGEQRTVRVAAVVADAPLNSSIRPDIYLRLPRLEPTTDGSTTQTPSASLFLAIEDAAAVPAIERLLVRIEAEATAGRPQGGGQGPTYTERVVRLGDLRLDDADDRAVVWALGGIGLLALLLAVVNYINLATARADLRAREVAVRKVAGAGRGQLIAQFLGESIATVALATLVGLALAELALPFLNSASGQSLTLRYVETDSILPVAALLVIVVGLLAGFYPAFVLSGFVPATVLGSARAPAGSRAGTRVRQGLVLMQFSVAVALLIGTAILFQQMRHLRTSDIGFDRAGLIVVPSSGGAGVGEAQRQATVARLATIPGVTAVGLSAVTIGGGSFALQPMTLEGRGGPETTLIEAQIGPGFDAVMRPRLIAGRLLDPGRFALDEGSVEVGTAPRREANIVVNRSAARALGFADPAGAVGRTLRSGDDVRRIVGVIEDMRFRSPRDPVDPQSYSFRSREMYNPVIAVRHESDPEPVIDAVTQVLRETAPTVPPLVRSADEALYTAFYRTDAQRANLFTIGALLAVVIGCIGLYGLAAFDTSRRVREIGIRKVLGATDGEVLRLLLGRFMGPVLVANVIAWPVAWVAMRHWLAGFDDRISLSILPFAAASLVTVTIAVATVTARALNASRQLPAVALRQE